MSLAVYPGTFDPITNGHVDILRRSLKIFDRVVVALADNIRKKPLFSLAERRGFITEALGGDPRLEVDAFQGLLAEYCRRRGATVVIRGLRALADFEYESADDTPQGHDDAKNAGNIRARGSQL